MKSILEVFKFYILLVFKVFIFYLFNFIFLVVLKVLQYFSLESYVHIMMSLYFRYQKSKEERDTPYRIHNTNAIWQYCAGYTHS